MIESNEAMAEEVVETTNDSSLTSGGLNWQDLPDSDLVPDGIYKCRISKVSDAKMSRGINPEEFISLQYKIDDGSEYDGRIIGDGFVKTRSAKLKKLLLAVNFDKAVFDNPQLTFLDAEIMVNVGSRGRGGSDEQNTAIGYTAVPID